MPLGNTNITGTLTLCFLDSDVQFFFPFSRNYDGSSVLFWWLPSNAANAWVYHTTPRLTSTKTDIGSTQLAKAGGMNQRSLVTS